MKVYIFINQQRKRADGSMPVYICVARPPKRLYIHTGLFSSAVFSDGVFPRTESNHKAKTIRLGEYLEQVEKIAIENSLLPHDELRNLIMDKVFGKSALGKSLADYLIVYAETCKAKRTREIYIATANKVREYDSGATLNITLAWLEDFTKSMQKEGLMTNSIAIHLRNIRAVMNWANKHELTSNYPFRNFSIPTEETRKRNIPVEQMRYIIGASELTPTQIKYRDLFVLMFYLIGVNSVDLLNAVPSQLKNGRFEYRRSKTGKLYSVKVEPEAKEIIDRYRGNRYLLCFCEKSQYQYVMRRANKALKQLGDGLTSYYARHTWATIAASLDIPMETIAAALGHSIGFKITSVYVDFNQRKVDEANRKVIDFILGDAE